MMPAATTPPTAPPAKSSSRFKLHELTRHPHDSRLCPASRSPLRACVSPASATDLHGLAAAARFVDDLRAKPGNMSACGVTQLAGSMVSCCPHAAPAARFKQEAHRPQGLCCCQSRQAHAAPAQGRQAGSAAIAECQRRRRCCCRLGWCRTGHHCQGTTRASAG